MVLLGALLLWSTSFLLSVPASAATGEPTPPTPPAASAATSTPADPNAVKTATTDPGDTVPGSDPLPTPGQQERSDQSCFLVLDKLEPGEATSDVVASGCAPRGSPPPAVPEVSGDPAAPSPAPSSTESPSAGPSSAGQQSTEQPTTPPSSETPAPRFSSDSTQGPARAAVPTAATASVPLVELYENTNFGGRSFIVYGNAGPCDASGYSISDSTTPNSTVGGVSSYKAYSNCLTQNLFNRTQCSGTNTVFNGFSQPLVGDAYDNSVLSMKLTSQNNCTTYTQTGGSVCGAIRNKYNQLGGPGGVLGYPTSGELTNPDGTGKRTTFQNSGSIYFSPPTGANQVQGAILAAWGQTGWERGRSGYPTSDELTNPDNVGKRETFATGRAFYWSPNTGAHDLRPDVLSGWGLTGYERGDWGYPTTSEAADGSMWRNEFSGGSALVDWLKISSDASARQPSFSRGVARQAVEPITCNVMLRDPHFSEPNRGNTVLFKTVVTCVSPNPADVATVRVMGTLDAVGGSPPPPGAKRGEGAPLGPPGVAARSDQTQTLTANGRDAKTYYTPDVGAPNVLGSSWYMGTATGQAVQPTGNSVTKQTPRVWVATP